MDVRHVAQRLGLSTKAVRGLILRGELPAYKVAGRVRVDPVDLDRYLAAARIRSQARRPAPQIPAVPTGSGLGGLRAVFRNSDAAA